MTKPDNQFKYPGLRSAMDGNTAVISCERESTDAAGAFPITPSTQMGEYWAEAAANGHINISGRPLIFIEPEGEHAAAAVTAGLSMTGLRSANFSSSQGIAYMHESLYAAVGKRLTYVLNMGCRAITKASLNVHAGHDDYHCIDDTGFFQLFAKNAQHVADLNIIAHRIAELALNPGIVAQDGFLTTHLIESLLLPERELIAEYLGRPDDVITCPTPAQKILYGETRRRVPELWDVDNPVMSGVVQNQDSYMQTVAAQRPFFFDHILELAEQAFKEFHELTGRTYKRVMTHRADDADYLIVGQGSIVSSAEVVADYLRDTRKIKVGVIDLVMFRPFPIDLIGEYLKGKKGVVVLERVDQPLAADLPLMREIRASIQKCIEAGKQNNPMASITAYQSLDDVPLLYSGSFGLGSRDLQAEGLIAAIENMLPTGKQKQQYYLGIDFLHEKAYTPKQEIHQQNIQSAYPHVEELALKGSENPNLMPPESISVRFHSVGGWGAITTGKNLAMTLFDLLGYHIKANPKYGSEKKGQPTTYYLSAAPEPIRMNCETIFVDVVLSPDPNVFNHTNALLGLREHGIFIIQSEFSDEQKVWESIPANYQKIIVDKNIKLFYLDAFAIARHEATDSDLQLRMQGIAFQGAFFAATDVIEKAGLDEDQLIKAIHKQLKHKFGDKGARVVEDNVRVVKRGFDEVKEVQSKSLSNAKALAIGIKKEPAMSVMLKRLPQGKQAIADVHRFWEETGSFYARGLANANLADPFMSLGVMPAVSSVFRDMTGIRFHHPQWIAENCTACGDCYTVCPDTAMPGLVSDINEVFNTAIRHIKRKHPDAETQIKAVRLVENKFRTLLKEANESSSVKALMDGAIESTQNEMAAKSTDDKSVEQTLQYLRSALEDFQFSITRPYYTLPEKKSPGSGGLFSISINPYTCKGCQECVSVCKDDALITVPQSQTTIQQLKDSWDFWLDLPTTPQKYIRFSDFEERIGALDNILLNKDTYLKLNSGDGACMGCTEKTVLHLFVSTVETLMSTRVEKHLHYLNDLIQRLEKHIQTRLVEEINIDDTEAMTQFVEQMGNGDVTLVDLAKQIEANHDTQPIDQAWLRYTTKLVKNLKHLRWSYAENNTGMGRSNMGIINATGCSSVWGSTFPFNPYPFPWSNHLFQDSPSMAMGVYEGHMAKMAEGFKTIRMAELELSGKPKTDQDERFFTYFNWEQFTDEEFKLCPPVVVVGGDGAMYDIGFQNLSRAMMSGKPLKIVVLDTQVYSNTGGQACTSGFLGQASDMAPFGKVNQGKQEIRKEIGLVAMAHRTTYVAQSTIAHPSHMIEGFVEGLLTKRPALFNCYSACQPEHGIADDAGYLQAKLAVESRAYPLFKYNPDLGKTASDCFDLSGNPDIDQDWPSYTLLYKESGLDKSIELPMTFADFAMTEGRFRKHFRTAPPDTWHENMIPLAEFIDLNEENREGKFPFIWTVNSKQNLSRLIVSETMVRSCEDRRDFWIMLKDLNQVASAETNVSEIQEKVKQELLQKFNAGILRLFDGENEIQFTEQHSIIEDESSAPATNSDFMAPWIDSDECTTCDECTKLNPAIFAYDENKHAIIKNADAGPYSDLVKAAERCTAQVIHPGLPRDRGLKDIDKWINRAEPYNG